MSFHDEDNPEEEEENEPDTKVCQICENYFDETNNMCVDTCEFGIGHNKVCLAEPCPKYFYMDGEVTVCVDECEGEHPYINGNECVSICPETTFLQEDKKTCGQSCDSKMYKDE